MATTIPKSIYRSSLDGCIHALDLDYYILCYGWLRPYHIYIIYSNFYKLDLETPFRYLGACMPQWQVIRI